MAIGFWKLLLLCRFFLFSIFFFQTITFQLSKIFSSTTRETHFLNNYKYALLPWFLHKQTKKTLSVVATTLFYAITVRGRDTFWKKTKTKSCLIPTANTKKQIHETAFPRKWPFPLLIAFFPRISPSRSVVIVIVINLLEV